MQLTQLWNTLPIFFGNEDTRAHADKKLECFAKLFSGYDFHYGTLTFEMGAATRSICAKRDTLSLCDDNTAHNAHIKLNKPLAFLWKLYSQGTMGFAKSYIEGDIDTDDLHALLNFAYINRQSFAALENTAHPLRGISKLWHTKQHQKRHNSRTNARKNISAHYDLGNDFYQLWLDGSMTYSSAYYTTPDQSLGDAQHAKINRIIDTLDLQESQRVLEIGCGWGSFATTAANRGVEVKGLTLSHEQCDYTNQRCAHLPDSAASAQAHLQDYRDEHEQYDALVSIEMFEAVGVDYWQTYFETLKRCLKPGGKTMLQIITIEGNEQTVVDYQNGSDFIQAYIFPGGVLPSKAQLRELAADNGFRVADEFCFGKDYATTLAEWRTKFNAVTDDLGKLGYNERFRRIWDYYLVYCQVGFEQQRIDVIHLLLENDE